MVTIFIGNLPPGIGSADVRCWMIEDGLAFLSCTIIKAKSVGYIDVQTEEDAERIIERYDGAPLGDRLLRCMLAKPRPMRSREPA